MTVSVYPFDTCARTPHTHTHHYHWARERMKRERQREGESKRDTSLVAGLSLLANWMGCDAAADGYSGRSLSDRDSPTWTTAVAAAAVVVQVTHALRFFTLARSFHGHRNTFRAHCYTCHFSSARPTFDGSLPSWYSPPLCDRELLVFNYIHVTRPTVMS